MHSDFEMSLALGDILELDSRVVLDLEKRAYP